MNCENLETVSFSGDVAILEGYVFFGCTSLKSISLPDSLAEIGQEAFSRSGLTSIVIPDGVTEVSSEAFYNCESLETAYVPGSVTIIKKNAFGACDNLTDIYYGGSEDSWKSLYTWDLDGVKVHYNYSY